MWLDLGTKQRGLGAELQQLGWKFSSQNILTEAIIYLTPAWRWPLESFLEHPHKRFGFPLEEGLGWGWFPADPGHCCGGEGRTSSMLLELVMDISWKSRGELPSGKSCGQNVGKLNRIPEKSTSKMRLGSGKVHFSKIFPTSRLIPVMHPLLQF